MKISKTSFRRSNMQEDLRSYVEAVEDHLRTYVTIADDSAFKVCAVWCATTYFMESWSFYPHMYIRAPMPESGKSVLAKAMLCAVENPYNAGGPTFASLIDKIEQAETKPTIFLDEAHQYFGHQAQQKWETFLLNTFDIKTAVETKQVRVNKGADWGARDTNIFVPVIFASNPCHIRSNVLSRCLTIDMLRNNRKDRKRLNERTQREYLETFAKKLKDSPGDHFKDYMDTTAETGLMGRSENIWLPLIALADCIGGQWSLDTRRIALEWSQRDTPQDEEADITQMLIEGCFNSFREADQLRSEDLIRSVNNYLREEGIEGLKDTQVVSQIKALGIRSTQLWIEVDGEKKNLRGYKREKFLPIFSAYCPELLEEVQVVAPIKGIEPDVFQNGHNDSPTHMSEALALARKSLTNKGL